MGTLFIVSTPIGNLQDITLRAVHILQTTEIIACEDTRRAGLLFKFLSEQFPQTVPTKRPTFISYYDDNEQVKTPQILNALINGINVAVISDAGTPTISDPGFKLVRECVSQNIPVISVPGASSVLSALVVSGLPTDKFLFIGYVPKKEGNRDKFLKELKESLLHIKTTVIAFEAPHRLSKTLGALQNAFGDIEVVLARELTKIHEEVQKNTIRYFITKYEKTIPKGEFVILFNLGEQHES